MEIVHIITGLERGGAETTLFRLCRHDRENRHTVISLMKDGYFGPKLRSMGVRVYCLGMSKGRLRLRSLLKLSSMLQKIKPDIVQTWMYHSNLIGGLAVALRSRRPLVWTIHHSEMARKAKITTRMATWMCAILSKSLPDQLIFCAEEAARIHEAQGYPQSKSIVIPNGYDPGEFKPDPTARRVLRREWGFGEHERILGMVGRFHPDKDHSNLFKALAILKQQKISFRCVLVGHGMERDNPILMSMLGKAGVSEHVLLAGARSDIPAVMNAFDIHVLSSATEAFPNVLAEAMACGIPCITTDVGDAATIVSTTGWTVPPGDPERLATAISKSLKELSGNGDWPGRKQLARRRITENFSISRMLAAYHRVWMSLLQSCG